MDKDNENKESKSVSSFFSKDGLKKFRSGCKAFADKQAVKVLAATMVLGAAFSGSMSGQNKASVQDTQQSDVVYAITQQNDTLCSIKTTQMDSAKHARLQNLVNGVCKTSTGQDILKSLSQQGTTIGFQSGISAIGFYDSKTNSITLNESQADAYLNSNIVHEGRHSVQDRVGHVNISVNNNIASNIMISTAMEADAVANQTKHCYELRCDGDSTAWNALLNQHKEAALAYESGVKEYSHIQDAQQRNDSIMTKTFKAWHQDSQYASGYHVKILQYHNNIVGKYSPEKLQKSTKLFQTQINASDLLVAVCSGNTNHSYAGTDGSILTTPETFYLAKNVKQGIYNYENNLKTKANKEDYSTDNMYVLGTSTTFDGSTFEITENISSTTKSLQSQIQSKSSTGNSLQAKLKTQQASNTVKAHVQSNANSVVR
ncbi:MAG: hypothetical protein MJ247_05405 [Alphaproteobacteria bacterium]|nr:hypothetical protein [Alphaproteobacteria bacterium]